MKLQLPPPHLLILMKVISTVLIISAIALELGEFYVFSSEKIYPPFIPLILMISRGALLVHFLEGLIGSIYDFFRGKNWLKSGIYVFFTGTVGLVELLNLFPVSETNFLQKKSNQPSE